MKTMKTSLLLAMMVFAGSLQYKASKQPQNINQNNSSIMGGGGND